jgi:hypothetical protein
MKVNIGNHVPSVAHADRVTRLVEFFLLGDCLLWVVVLKIAEVAQFFVLHFPR